MTGPRPAGSGRGHAGLRRGQRDLAVIDFGGGGRRASRRARGRRRRRARARRHLLDARGVRRADAVTREAPRRATGDHHIHLLTRDGVARDAISADDVVAAAGDADAAPAEALLNGRRPGVLVARDDVAAKDGALLVVAVKHTRKQVCLLAREGRAGQGSGGCTPPPPPPQPHASSAHDSSIVKVAAARAGSAVMVAPRGVVTARTHKIVGLSHKPEVAPGPAARTGLCDPNIRR